MHLKAAPYCINLMTEDEQISMINNYHSNVYKYIYEPSEKVTIAYQAKVLISPTQSLTKENLNWNTTKILNYSKEDFLAIPSDVYYSLNLTRFISDKDKNLVYNKKIPIEIYKYVFTSYWIKHLKVNFNNIKADEETLNILKKLYMETVL